MKIIKSFLLITVGLFASALLFAQEATTTKLKIPPAAVESNKPSPAPELKPMPMDGVVPKDAPVAIQQTSSSLKKDEGKPRLEEPKVVALTIEANGPKNKLTPEQLKTLNGISEKPKLVAPAAALDPQQNVKPEIFIAPAPVVIKNENS